MTNDGRAAALALTTYYLLLTIQCYCEVIAVYIPHLKKKEQTKKRISSETSLLGSLPIPASTTDLCTRRTRAPVYKSAMPAPPVLQIWPAS